MPDATRFSITATRLAFFIAGFILASWAPMIPMIKARLALSDGAMGGVLLAFGLGSLITMPFSGGLAARFGCRHVFTGAMGLSLLALFSLITLDQQGWVTVALFVFGMSVGAMDVIVNLHAVMVEKRAQRAIMSSVHALFSLGGMLGAASVSGLLALSLSPMMIIAIEAIVLSSLLYAIHSGLSNDAQTQHTPFLVRPRGIVILLGLLCFIAYIVEGAMLDWSGILLIQQHQISAAQAGMGYTLFALTMTCGRVLGDRCVRALGRRQVFVLSSGMTTLGLAILAMNPPLWGAAIAFLMIGLGLSNIAPILFSASGRQQVMPDALAVAAVSTLGYAGILLGPALIGGWAHFVTLNGAFACIAVLSCLLFAYARRA